MYAAVSCPNSSEPGFPAVREVMGYSARIHGGCGYRGPTDLPNVANLREVGTQRVGRAPARHPDDGSLERIRHAAWTTPTSSELREPNSRLSVDARALARAATQTALAQLGNTPVTDRGNEWARLVLRAML